MAEADRLWHGVGAGISNAYREDTGSFGEYRHALRERLVTGLSGGVAVTERSMFCNGFLVPDDEGQGAGGHVRRCDLRKSQCVDGRSTGDEINFAAFLCGVQSHDDAAPGSALFRFAAPKRGVQHADEVAPGSAGFNVGAFVRGVQPGVTPPTP